jgi:hypothetical protein
LIREDWFMPVTRRTKVARWGGVLLVALAPLPWLGIGSAVAAGDAAGTPGNKGTLKVHEQGTPSGFEDNDPKVCVFNFEGFSFDEGQTGYIMIAGQGQSSGSFGPISFGPTDVNGFYATEYVNDGGLTVPDGHYKATLYGKQLPGGELTDVKAKSKVFKVTCEETSTPTPTETETTETPTPTDTETTETATPTETETTETATPTETETTDSPSPTDTETSETATPPSSSPEVTETGSSEPGTDTPSTSVKPTRLTQPATLPQTGSGVPVAGALAASLLLIGLGALLLMGPGRLAAERYSRKH